MLTLEEFAARWQELCVKSLVVYGICSKYKEYAFAKLPRHLQNEALHLMNVEPVTHQPSGLIIGYKDRG